MTDLANVDKGERAEQERLESRIGENEKKEEKAWGIKSDTAAFGRKKIEIPDRW